uniref:Ovule protein n=1 Tax=Heterorhabditis bacteriophora TaxID=37862 RepID=A0A1I7WMP5_HETBA
MEAPVKIAQNYKFALSSSTPTNKEDQHLFRFKDQDIRPKDLEQCNLLYRDHVSNKIKTPVTHKQH